MAEANHAEMFCIGCEMVGTDHREQEWRGLIGEVRKIYSGPLTYNCDKYQEDRVAWWDALDLISSSGYYPADDLDRQFARIQAVDALLADEDMRQYFLDGDSDYQRAMTQPTAHAAALLTESALPFVQLPLAVNVRSRLPARSFQTVALGLCAPVPALSMPSHCVINPSCT